MQSGTDNLIITFKQKILLIFFGIILAFVVIETGLRMGGFVFLSLQEFRNWLAVKTKGAYCIVCIGESTTASQYPCHLQEVLNNSDIGIRFNVIDKGIIGTNTSKILNNLNAWLIKYKPDMVVAMMGINDFGSHMSYEGAAVSKGRSFKNYFRIYKLYRIIAAKFKKNNYRDDMDLSSTLCAVKKAVELNPKDDNAYAKLAWLYILDRKFAFAEDAAKKAAELNAKNDTAFLVLAWAYMAKEDFLRAEEAAKRAIELNPTNDLNYMVLAKIYFMQNDFSRAEEATNKIIELNPNNDAAYGLLGTLYSQTVNYVFARKYYEKANELRMNYFRPSTAKNILRLKNTLDINNIRMVYAQYPMRSIEPLKRLFGKDKKVILVDNDEIFKDAVQREGYKEYFTDIFGGDFGHCTVNGNRLLAKNIAQAILKEVFNNKFDGDK